MADEKWLMEGDADGDNTVVSKEDEAYVLGEDPIDSSINDEAEDPVSVV